MSTLTAREFLVDLQNTLAGVWSACWLPDDPQSVIVQTPTGTRDLKTLDAELPHGLRALGWTGLTKSGMARWIGWDLDVDHGPTCYLTREAALLDAHRLREALDGCAEIRLSKSGQGAHIRHWLAPAGLSNEEAKLFAKGIAKRLNIRADKTVASRQCFHAWTHKPTPDSFRLIAEDEALEKHLLGGYADATA